MAMARHLGMWPAVEACSALMKEQELQLHPGRRCSSLCADGCRERYRQQRESRRKKVLRLEDAMDNNFSLMLDVSDESLDGSPRRNLRRTPKSQSHNGLPLSPSHRMKLMDFKSPSSKKAATPRHAVATPQSRSFSPVTPSNTRLLRSSPGAAKEVRRLLPTAETPRRSKKPHSVSQLSCSSRSRPTTMPSPVRVKQEVVEVGEDEQDYARAQEKYKLMNVLGLQRTALLPRPEDLIGWRQKKRLRKLKANNYSLTKRRKPRATSPTLPFGDVTLSLPLCNPVNSHLLKKSAKTKPVGPASKTQTTTKRPKVASRAVPPSDRRMRSQGVLPDIFSPSFGRRELRRSVRKGDSSHISAQQPPRRKTNKAVVRNIVRIKSEPDEYSISGLPFLSDAQHGHNPDKAPPSQRTQAKNSAETVRTLRYNTSRATAKGKLRRGSARQAEKAKRKPREEGKRVSSNGLKGFADARPKGKVNECNGLPFSEQEPPPSIYNHPLYKVIKKEPADPIPVGGPFPDPPSPDLGKRQSKPPIKLLDSGFLFSFCRPAGGAMAVLKKEEESVDICLTRSVARVGENFEPGEPNHYHRALRARAPPSLPVVKKERVERSVSQSTASRPRPMSRNNTLNLVRPAESKATGTMPKRGKLPLSSKSCTMLDAVRRARLKQLRGPRSQAPKVPKAAHTCVQCPATYKDCDALMMHRLRHIEGKHWPCPLCCKTFFRLRNVRNHIRTHDPKLYKCRSCIIAGS
ncbi:uncharacterized protein V6R79_002690 [Siganus canaliculatus]